jgi:hypothetical protein
MTLAASARVPIRVSPVLASMSIATDPSTAAAINTLSHVIVCSSVQACRAFDLPVLSQLPSGQSHGIPLAPHRPPAAECFGVKETNDTFH